MATVSGQPTANLASTPIIGAGRASSSSVPPPAESPNVPVPSPSLAGVASNGGANGFLPPTAMAGNGPMGTDLRLYPRDGRVRNPVPSKLKDVNEQMKGNFSVMHMDVASHRASEGRDAAAKRTSESTAMQAKMAQTDTYVSHQRRANYPRQPGLKQFSSPPKSASAEPVAEPEPGPQPHQPLAVEETKSEQARLLTLLRTLSPPTVVDQICKAVAFFGGIPDAPPPADGHFPESEQSNGPGSLFVGWIAEIFPDLEHPRKSAPPPSAKTAVGQRRPRGRPKGSKASKARSDKGLKKGTVKGAKGVENQDHDPQDESWVDVEDSVLELNDNGDLIEAEEAFKNGPITPLRAVDGEPVTTTSTAGSKGGFRSINNNTIAPASSVKRRGRPKGSKNRPKETTGAQQGSQTTSTTSTTTNISAPTQPAKVSTLQPPPKVTPVPVPVPMFDTQPKKVNGARPKNTKNRSKASGQVTGHDATVTQQQPAGLSSNQSSQPTGPASATSSFVDSLTASQGAPTQLPTQTAASSSQTPTPQVKPSSVVGKKRKRQTANTGISASKADANVAPGGNNILPQQAPTVTAQVIPPRQSQNQVGQPIQQHAASVTPVPPAKRSRKSQDSGSTAASKRQNPNTQGSKNSTVTSAPAATEPIRPSSQVGAASQSHTRAEGLEAHYEQMAAMQGHSDQIQGYHSRPQQSSHQAIASIASIASPAPVPSQAPAPAEGLEAHYERFAALQNYQDSSRQSSASRQQQKQQQQIPQTVSPIPSQTSRAPQMTMAPQQQARAPQNYYSPSQTLSSSYSTHQPSYSSATQRQPPQMASNSPGAGLVSHVNNSPQFGTQSNSPLMQADNNYRGSPSLIHNNAAFAPRRTPSASPLDNHTYRPTSTTSHGLPNHSPHFGTRQPSTTTTTHNTSHSGLPSAFPSFSDSGFLDIQSLDSGSSHGGLNLGTGSYGLSSGSLPQQQQQQQQQRTTGSSAASLYSPATGMNSSYLGPSNVGRASQSRWPS